MVTVGSLLSETRKPPFARRTKGRDIAAGKALHSLPMGGSWQILERPHEQAELRSALSDPTVAGAVLVGPAGVGKTTLARWATAEAPGPVHWVACTESSRAIPLGAFAHWVAPHTGRDPIALITSVWEALDLGSGRGPVATVCVDDAHLMDQLSATLVHQIALERSARVVATVRDGEPVPDAVVSLWKDSYLRRLDLHPLSKKESVALIESVLDGTLEELSADVIWETSGGNPLFLQSMVEAALEAGTLSMVDGVWQLRGPTAVPAGLATLLDARLDRAGQEVLPALRVLALYEPIDLDELVQVAGERAVDAAEMHDLIRLVRVDSRMTAQFSHPLLGTVVRRRTGTASARKLRRQLAQLMQPRDRNSATGRIRLAQLGLDSDGPVDLELNIKAAKDAIYLSNLPMGERLARAAFDAGGGLRAAELLSTALLWQGHPHAADSILAGFDPAELDQLQLVHWGIPRMSIKFWSMGDVTGSNAILQLLQQRVDHPALRLVVDAAGSAMAIHENRIDVGIAEALRVLGDPESPRQAVDWAAFGAGLAMPVAGRGLEFGPIADRCRAEQKSTDGMIRVMVRYGDVLALTYTGQFDLAERRAREYADFSSSGQFVGWALAKIMQGLVATHRGQFRTTITSIEQALAALNAETSLPWQLPARLLLVRAHAALGDIESAEKVLTRTAEHAGPHLALHEPLVLIARAWLAAASGADHDAVDLARQAARVASTGGQCAVEAEALHHATRFGDRRAAPRLSQLADRIAGPLGGIYARHAAAVADARPGALDAVSLEFERAGLLLSAADASAAAVSLHDRDGSSRSRRLAAAASERALRLADRCDGATSPALRNASRPLPITAREREISALVARGLSNREIAERLTVSVRTVEGHIYRACIKLDVADREALARLVWNDHAPPLRKDSS